MKDEVLPSIYLLEFDECIKYIKGNKERLPMLIYASIYGPFLVSVHGYKSYMNFMDRGIKMTIYILDKVP